VWVRRGRSGWVRGVWVYVGGGGGGGGGVGRIDPIIIATGGFLYINYLNRNNSIDFCCIIIIFALLNLLY